MESKSRMDGQNMPGEMVFALDIGTRSIIGMLGTVEGDRMNVIAVERAEHTSRAMKDGQIEDIREVARIAGRVKETLEEKSGCSLDRVFVAAAGRALKTEYASFELEFPEPENINEELISRLEAGAVGEAQKCFLEKEDGTKQFYLAGYSVSQYYLDDYLISSLLDHKGRKIKADVVATFLPGEVVDSLYTAMHRAGLEVAGLTLEPIAAMNVAIPEKLRLLNLVMVDIGAGTSDIAVCRDGKIVGYTMATLAGDEITESIMRRYLVDFDTAEAIKRKLDEGQEIRFTDIVGFDHRLASEEVRESLQESVNRLGKEIADRILEVNQGAPSAVFLAGGGSRMSGLMEQVSEALGLDAGRASVAGRYYSLHAYSEVFDIQDPEYATPLGILVSAGLNLIQDSFSVKLNGKQAKLFSNGTLTVSDILMMNGYGYSDFISRSGKSIVVSVNGERRIFYGEAGEPAVLKRNGEDAKISELVHAGDTILFTPAHNGRDAAAAVADVFRDETGAAPEQVLLNGRLAGWEEALQYGDVIETIPVAKVDYGERLPEEQEQRSAREHQDEQEHQEEREHREAQEHIEDRENPDGPAEPLQQKRYVTVELNAKTLVLQAKEDGSPYYLMDLLQHSGLDLEHIQAPVVLKVNGAPASFQRELKENDTVEIYEDKTNS